MERGGVTKKQQLTLLIISVLFITVFLQWTSYGLKKKSKSLNSIWLRNHEVVVERIQILNDFRNNFGYGGFIHHFKNFLIRKDVQYLQKAQQSLSRTKEALQKLNVLCTEESEKKIYQQLDSVVSTYTEKFDALKLLIAENPGSTIRDLDRVIRVDDTPAFEAIDILSRQFEKNGKLAESAAKNELEAMQSLIEFLLYILHPFVFIAAALYLIYLYKTFSALKEISAIFHASPEVLLISDRQGRIIRHNKRAETLLEYSKKELSGLVIEDLISPDPGKKHRHKQLRQKFIDTTIKPGLKEGDFKTVMGFKRPNEEFFARTKSGELIPVKIRLTGYFDNNDLRVVASVVDLSNQRKLERRALTDPLTSLANKASIDMQLIRELQRARRYNRDLAIIFVDIDHFKQVNDRYGHQVGDEVLKKVAKILKDRVRESDTVGRFGGEEFLIICPEANEQNAVLLGEALREAVSSESFGEPAHLTASFGVSVLKKDDGKTCIDMMLKRADEALYAAKQNGRDQVRSKL